MAVQFDFIIKLEADMTISYRVQCERATGPSAFVLSIVSKARSCGSRAMGCFLKPYADLTRLNSHLRDDAGIDEQSVIEDTAKRANLIR